MSVRCESSAVKRGAERWKPHTAGINNLVPDTDGPGLEIQAITQCLDGALDILWCA